MVYHAAQAKVVLFGGSTGPTGPEISNETWVYDTNGAWTQLQISGPSARTDATGGYHPDLGGTGPAVVVYGGNAPGDPRDTWHLRFTGGNWSWTPGPQGPISRSNAAMAYLPAAGALVTELPRQPGSRENRWMHLLSGPPAVQIAAAPASTPGEVRSAPSEIAGLKASVESLQNEVAELKARLEKICAELGIRG